MDNRNLIIRNAMPEEFTAIGKLMVDVYSKLDGFPDKSELPSYYDYLANVGNLTQQENTELLTAISSKNKVVGAVVYFNDLKNYGTIGTITKIKNASGFRLLAVDSKEQGKGIGKLLILECIKRTKQRNQKHLYIHSTESMKIAWGMYEKLGFSRCPEIDFVQNNIYVYGFRLSL